jgi:hypothetical protein
MKDPVPRTEAGNRTPVDDALLRKEDTKDMTLVPKWSGTKTAIPITRFFDAIEGAGTMGNWTDADKVGG